LLRRRSAHGSLSASASLQAPHALRSGRSQSYKPISAGHRTFQVPRNRSHNPACPNGSAPIPLLRLCSKSAIRWERKVGAHPCVSRHRGKSASVLIRRLTLPSSGPAYGGPLKSNVRPHNNDNRCHSMDLDLNHPSDKVLHRVSSRSAEVGRSVAGAMKRAGLPLDRFHFDNASDDPFAFDLAIQDSRDLIYKAGIDLGVMIQDALRESSADGWRVRLLVKPESEDLVFDYLTWLVIDLVRITEYRGGRTVEMFKSIESFRTACWGASAA